MFAKQTTELNNAGIKAGSIFQLCKFDGDEVWVRIHSFNKRNGEFDLEKLNDRSLHFQIRAVFSDGWLFEAPDHKVDMYDVREGALVLTSEGPVEYQYGMSYIPTAGLFTKGNKPFKRADDFKPGVSYTVRKELLDEFPGLIKRTVAAMEELIGVKIDPDQQSTTGATRTERDDNTGAMTVHLDAKHTAMVLELVLTAIETYNTVSKVIKATINIGGKFGIKSFLKEKTKAINRRERQLTFRPEKSDKSSWGNI